MRTLKFNIDGQVLKLDPECDLSGLVPGTEGYLQAEFNFSNDWAGTTKTVQFFRGYGGYAKAGLKDGKSCMIPASAAKGRKFDIRVVGEKRGSTLITNRVTIVQDGGMV